MFFPLGRLQYLLEAVPGNETINDFLLIQWQYYYVLMCVGSDSLFVKYCAMPVKWFDIPPLPLVG